MIAKANGIYLTLLLGWVDKFRRSQLMEDEGQAEKVRGYEVQVAAWERKVGQFVMEIDFLKKGGADTAHLRGAVHRLRAGGWSAAEGCHAMSLARSTH